MLVILFVTVGVTLMLYNIKRRNAIYLTIALSMLILAVILEVFAPNEKVLIEQNQLLVGVVDPDYYITYIQQDEKVIFRYVNDNSIFGWTEDILTENYNLYVEDSCNNPRREVYKNKVIGLIRVNIATDAEEIRLYVPSNGISIL